MIQLTRRSPSPAAELAIKIIGVGGAGSNALDRIQLDGFDGSGLLALNTDIQALASSVAGEKVRLGSNTTRGLGAGGDPEIGYAAAGESVEEIRAAISGAHLIFLCVGLGGGTGSGAAPLVAALAREVGAMVVVFATLPFAFEGRRRVAQAEEALAALQQNADLVICFENDRMADAVSPRASVQEAFAAADLTISQSVRAVAALAERRGLINVGFDELATILRSQHPRCLFGFGEAEGDNRAHGALERALKSPLMDRGRMLGDVENVLINIAGGPNLTLNEVQILMEEFNRHVSSSARILFGISVEPRLGNRLAVTILTSVGAPVRAGSELSRAAIAEALPPEIEPVASPAPPFETAVEPPLPLLDEHETVPVPAIEPRRSPISTRAVRSAPVTPEAKREVRQEQMQFEPVTRGRFEKSEPTIVDGQDLDVPTFLRRAARVK